MNGYQQFPHSEKVEVSLDLQGEVTPLGTLAWSRREGRSYFEYAQEFIERALPVSPFQLPVRAGARPAPATPFRGLHGLFNDSLPDGWGRWLLDRWLRQRNYNKDDLTALDRLTFVGAAGMGALVYEPDKTEGKIAADGDIDLDWVASEIEKFQTEIDDADVDRLYAMQGGSGGARPKILIGRNVQARRIVAGAAPKKGFEPWLIKFRSSAHDHAEIGAEEYAYSLMAKACGVDMPETDLLVTPRGKYFAVRRFDRTAGGRLHIQTPSALLEVDHNIPQIDYEQLLKLTRVLTRHDEHVRQMFKRMVFNVLSRNRDDHSKNHAFAMAKDGSWRPTPAYDLTLSAGPNGQHSLAIAGEGREPGPRHVADVALRASVAKGDAEAIFEEVKLAVENWPSFAEKAQLSERRAAEIDYLLNRRGRGPKGGVAVATRPPSA